jgi:NADPH2:quinone reductase|tara:strand:+ start:62851 stop:63825 length:975 start_codon:yes stop_codon:yes gene_type:complete
MTFAIKIEKHGPPEVMQYTNIDIGSPMNDQVRIDHTAIGVNFIDTYFRSGLYPINLPSGLGGEAAGVIKELGKEVKNFKLGDRVAYVSPPPSNSYSQSILIDSKKLIKLPDDIDDKTAGALLLKGLTSWYLLRKTFIPKKGDYILLYAAAGGVGLIMSQWARYLGLKVIGVVSTEEKKKLALENGCSDVLLSGEDIVEAVKSITNGLGVPVVYDPIGKDTLYDSLDCLSPKGLLVSYGNASGVIDCLPILELLKRGSLYVTRPTLWSYIKERKDFEEGCKELFNLVRKKAITAKIGQSFPLEKAVDAHHALEKRQTKGSTILIP